LKRVALIILDGFGHREEKMGNAILSANLKYYNYLKTTYPFTTLKASGLAVGLPEGQMGNSEVGHLNIGAGRIVYQIYTKINKSIEDGSFNNIPVLLDAIENVKKYNSSFHIIGLLSDGGVHSHIQHFYAVLELLKKNGIKSVYIHANLDGRDVPPTSALEYVKSLEDKINSIGIGKIATIMGRYYGMDRDNRWERVKLAYDAMVYRKGLISSSSIEAVKNAYERGETDEFVKPTVIGKEGAIKENDSVLFINFRPDRARQISRALALKDFSEFETEKMNIFYITMAEYDKTFPFPIVFPPDNMENILAKVLEINNKKQLRIAETEKYAHVTFFFNGQIEEPFKGEDRVLIPSPKVSTYDLKPEMSAYEVTDEILKRVKDYDVYIINYANPDMVGHTGDFEATVKALKAIDNCIEKVVETFKKEGISVIVTADHGNAEIMIDENGSKVTSHTTCPVPFIIVDTKKYNLRSDGILADIAPTILDIMGIQKPPEMTGKSLIINS